MKENLHDYMIRNQEIVYKEFKKHLYNLSIPKRLKESMLYSLEAGGKRLRPILLIASCQTYDQNVNRAITTAIALEMIHTYSLIHDDLPAMDDDKLRRGKPTNHVVFDDATAILAGDALLTYSFEMIASDSLLSDNEKVKLVKMLAANSGPKGMVAGQILDMEAENKSVNLEEIEEIHTLKTGALLNFAITAGAYLGDATSEELSHLDIFSYYLGLIFQVQDDILDIVGETNKLGKKAGSDEDNEKSTYPKLLGLDGAKKQKQIYVMKAKESLIKANAMDSYLFDLTDYLTQRDH